MGVNHFQELIVWQLADALRREVIAITATGAAARDFKFRDQIRDAIASACRNTSEGFDRFRPAEFARALEFARGSLGEVQDCLIDAHTRGYIDGERFDKMWRLAKRASGANTRLVAYLKDCVARGLTPWIPSEPRRKQLPQRENQTHDRDQQAEGDKQKCATDNLDAGAENPEPGT